MARPYRRTNKDTGKKGGAWYVKIRGRALNLKCSGERDAQEAERRAELAKAASKRGTPFTRLHESWEAAAAGRAAAAAVHAPAEAPPPPPPPPEAPPSGRPLPTLAELEAGHDAEDAAQAEADRLSPQAPREETPPPPPPIDAAAAANAAAEEVEGAGDAAAATTARASFDDEFKTKFPQLSGEAGAMQDVVFDWAAAGLLWLDRKIPEMGVRAYYKKRGSKRRLVTRPSMPTDISRGCVALGLKHTVLAWWPTMFDKITPPVALVGGLIGGAIVAVAQGEFIDEDGTRTPVAGIIAGAFKSDDEAAAAPAAAPEPS